LGSKTPLQAMKDWQKFKPELFKKSHTTCRDVTTRDYNDRMFIPEKM